MERGPNQPEASGAGYLCFQREHAAGEEECEWAGLLVVNPNGLPLEFLYSGPLRPTPVQQILYQDQLAREVRLSLVRSLRKGLRSRLLFTAAADYEADPAFQVELGCPLLILDGEHEAWATEVTPAARAMRERLEEVVGVGEPLGRTRAALAYVVEFERKGS
ncbi:MAG: hypothetical protein K0Q72_2757 [Armatimonadetes bacterium]|nr:hypothetical protein [Armatimonadota bacterium]